MHMLNMAFRRKVIDIKKKYSGMNGFKAGRLNAMLLGSNHCHQFFKNLNVKPSGGLLAQRGLCA